MGNQIIPMAYSAVGVDESHQSYNATYQPYNATYATQ